MTFSCFMCLFCFVLFGQQEESRNVSDGRPQTLSLPSDNCELYSFSFFLKAAVSEKAASVDSHSGKWFPIKTNKMLEWTNDSLCFKDYYLAFFLVLALRLGEDFLNA